MINLPPSSGQRHKPDRQQLLDAAASAGLVVPDAAVQALQNGRVIEAIKLIRTANPGLDLTRAKAAMERLQAQGRPGTGDSNAGPDAATTASPTQHMQKRQPTVVMGDQPGQLRWLLLVVALAALAAWIAFGGRP